MRFVFILMTVVVLAWGWFYFLSPKTAPVPLIYRIAYDNTWFPLQLDGKEKNITGFSLDLVNAIADNQGIKVDLIQVESADILRGLDRRYFDGLLSPLSLRDALSDKYASSKSYYEIGPVLVVTTASPIKSVEDLGGKTIGLIASDELIPALHQHSTINFRFYEYRNKYKMFEDLVHNEIDGLVYKMIPAYELINNYYPNQLRVITPPLTKEGLHLIIKNDQRSQPLILYFNNGLEAIKEKGIYNELIKRWSLINPMEIPLKPQTPILSPLKDYQR